MAVDYMGSLIDPLAKVQQGQDYVNKIAAYGTQRQAGSQYASGDPRGASQTLARGGDIAGAVGIQRSEAERLTMQQAYIKQALPVFQAALQRGGPEAVVNAYQQITPDLKRIGMSDEEIAQFGQRLQTDPQGTIQGLAPFAQGKWEFRDGGNGQVLVYRDGQYVRTDMGRYQKGRPGEVILDYGAPGQGTQRETPLVTPAIPPTPGSAPSPAPVVGGAAAATMPAAPVPSQPAPQTAAAPVVAPPMPQAAAAGAVQPRIPVAMAPDPVPPRPGIPPSSAVALGLSNPEDPMGGGGISRASAGGLARATPEGPRVAMTVPGKPTAAPQRWRAATAQEQARYPGQAIQVNEATGEIKTVGSRGSGTPRLSPQQETDLRNLRVAVRDQAAVATDMQRFMALNQRVKTGTNYYFGIQKDLAAATDNDVSVMQSIIQRNVPRMRQGLPGAASDLDIKMFREALPALDRPRAANDAIARAAIAWSKRQQDYVSFVEDFARRNGTILGANEKWQEYTNANPLFQERGDVIDARRVTPWRQWMSQRGTQQQQPSDGWSIQRVQ